MQGASTYGQLESTCKGVAFNLRQTSVYYLWKDLPLSLALQFVTYSQGKDRCSELAICSFCCSLTEFLDLILRSFLLKTLFSLPVCMKCGKAVIVPISLQLKAPGTNCGQYPAETCPSPSKRSFTKEGPVSLQTASQAVEKQWFLECVAHIHMSTWERTQLVGWKAQVSFQGIMGLSPGWAWGIHTGQLDICKWHFVQSVPSFLVLQIPITPLNGGEGLKR